jgi:DNA-binding Lrp family transcriptional regulator
MAYLELKPLFICSIILNDGGRIPYQKVAEFLRLSISGVRAKIKTLKRHKLARIDRDNNLHLGTYKRFRYVIRHQGHRTYKFLNNGETKNLVRATAISENLERQKHVLFNKILKREFINEYVRNSHNANTVQGFFNNLECPDKLILTDHHARKWKKIVRINWKYLLEKWEKTYYRQMQTRELPDVNPEITLSCQGIARVLGRKAKSTGHYQTRLLIKAGLLKSDGGGYITMPTQSAAVFENMYGMRPDVFSYNYPTRLTRSGFERKYFRRCTNIIATRINTIFF